MNVKRVYRLYLEESLSVRRKKRKRLVRDRAAEPRLLQANQEWAMDFIVDGLRDEYLNISWFRMLGDVREKLADWQQEYNCERAHSSLDDCSPAEFRATLNLAKGYGDVESKLRFPHHHSPYDGCEINISKQNQTQKTPVMNG